MDKKNGSNMDPDISPQEPEVNVDNINIESDDAVEEFSFETDTKEEEGEPSEEEIAVIERIRIFFFFFFRLIRGEKYETRHCLYILTQ